MFSVCELLFSVFDGLVDWEVYLLGPVPFIKAALEPEEDLPPSIKFIFAKYIFLGTLKSVLVKFLCILFITVDHNFAADELPPEILFLEIVLPFVSFLPASSPI